MAKSKDQYSQIGYLNVTESAAATLTFNGLSVFSNVLGQKGMIIHEAEYTFTAAVLAVLNASSDGVEFGLSGTDSMTAIALNDPEVYDYNLIQLIAHGTPADMATYNLPRVKDFSRLPGGGVLVPADRLFAYIHGVNTGSALGMTMRFRYSIVELTAADYLELAQSMRVLK